MNHRKNLIWLGFSCLGFLFPEFVGQSFQRCVFIAPVKYHTLAREFRRRRGDMGVYRGEVSCIYIYTDRAL